MGLREGFEGAEGGVEPGGDPEFGKEVGEVLFHRGFRHGEDDGDVGVTFALGEPEEDLGFARGKAETFEGLRGLEGGSELGLKFEEALAVEPGFDGFQEVVLCDRFDKVVIGSAVHSDADVGGFAPGGEEDEGDVGGFLVVPEGFEDPVAVEVGHRDVAEDEVREGFPGQGDSLGAVGGGSDGKILEFEHHDEVFPHDAFVFDDQDLFHGDGCGHAKLGCRVLSGTDLCRVDPVRSHAAIMTEGGVAGPYVQGGMGGWAILAPWGAGWWGFRFEIAFGIGAIEQSSAHGCGGGFQSRMVLVIDNYDSFTYNLVQYLGEFRVPIEVRRNDQVTLDEIEGMKPDRILVSPGPCSPREAGFSNEIIRTFGPRLPLLGVCLGHQCIGHVYGGEVVVNHRMMHGKTSPIRHDGRGVFSGMPNPFTATRYHSLVIRRETIPGCLEITAETEEGEIMGVRHREFPVHGVQFHPESILTESGRTIIRNFLELPAGRG